VFGQREKGVDIGTYRARNGTFAVKSTVKKTTSTQEVTEGIPHINAYEESRERKQSDKKLLETQPWNRIN
jgi:hypothetical protein